MQGQLNALTLRIFERSLTLNIKYLTYTNRLFRAYGCTLPALKELSYITKIEANWIGCRSGLRFVLFTEEQWEGLADSPDAAKSFAFGGDFRNHIDDCVFVQELLEEAETWMSPKLNTWIEPHRGRQLIAAVICQDELRDLNVKWLSLSENDRAIEIISLLSDDFLQTNNIKTPRKASDVEVVKQQVAYYFKNRTAPFYTTGACNTEDIEIAEMACSHIFQPKPIVEKPQKIEPFFWGSDPVNFSQWVIAWNRHGHWISLARAYAEKKDERYAQEYVFELSKWMEQTPILLNQQLAFIIGTVFEPSRLSHYLDSGLRLAHTWWESFEIFRKSESMTPDDIMKFLDGIIDQAEYLSDPRAEDVYGNWGAAAAAGLLAASVMLPECRLAEKWKEISISRIQKILDAQFYPDGAQIELTPTYQCGAADFIVSALRLAKENNIETRIDLGRFEAIFEYLLKTATPNRTSPPFNDSPWKQLAPIFQVAYPLFKREDFLWFAAEGKAGSIPQVKSLFLPYAGYAIMRTGYNEDDYYTAFDVGPFGSAHQHEDKLNFVITCGSTRLLTEGGVYNYDYSPHHRYALSSRAHNVILVDGMPQKRAGKTETYVTHEPIDCDWDSNEEFDYARGCYSDGFSDGVNCANVLHERKLWFHKKNISWVVCDTLIPEDEEEHSYEALFHFDAGELTYSIQENKITIKHNDKTLTLKPNSENEFAVKIQNGVTDPEVQGWVRLDNGEVVPRPAVSYVWKCKGPTHVTWELNIC